MADFKNLIDIDDLAIFKNQADLLYATQTTTTGIANRVTALENAGADDNTIETIKVNGSALTPDANKAVNISVPTAVTDLSDASNYALAASIPDSLSDLTNDNNTVTDASYVHTDNNFTNALLAKLNGIDDSADVNVIEHIKVNNVEQTITNKTVDLTATEGTTNGTIKIAGTDVPVHGLGTAAYVNATALGDDNVIETVKVNGTALTPDANKAVNVVVPTTVAGLSDASNYALVANLGTAAAANTESTVANDTGLPTGAAVQTYVTGLGYQNASQVGTLVEAYGYATQSYVNTAIGNANHLQSSLVSSLPASGQTNILYLVPDDGGKSNKDMYIWDATGSQFVLVGNTEVDLTGYAVESQFSVATTAQIQALFSAA